MEDTARGRATAFLALASAGCRALTISALALHCSSVDARDPEVAQGSAGTGTEQATPALQPAPAFNAPSSAGTAAASTPPDVNAPSGDGARGADPGASVAPGTPGAECGPQQTCASSLACGSSATPSTGTGRVCCDQACDGACQGCSVGAGGGICSPLGDAVPCTTGSSRAGACAQPGACTEYCAAGVSRAGACLVQPG